VEPAFTATTDCCAPCAVDGENAVGDLAEILADDVR
jgi:hypothetical protein